MYNLFTVDPNCAVADEWYPGRVPYLKIYYPDSASDEDTDGSDGIPNSADNAYLSGNPGQQDTDGDGYGNMCDADFDNSGSVIINDFNMMNSVWGAADPVIDMNSDGVIDISDFNLLNGQWGNSAPYY